jgi:Na+-translocating ferredoxin:NAD+ oxidoreductase RnfG subunit
VIIRGRKSMDRKHNGQNEKTNGQTTIYKSLHRKQNSQTLVSITCKRGYETIRVRGVVPSTCNVMLLVSVVINCQSAISPDM